MFCARCGTPNSNEAKFCIRCGEATGQDPAPANVLANDVASLPTDQPSKRHWYFSGPVLLLTFLFLTPAWAILILADRRRSKELKAFAALVALGYVVLVVVLYEQTGISPYNEGVRDMQTGQMTLAEQQFKLALARNPDLAEAHLNLGKIYLESGRLDGAQIETEKAVQIFERTKKTIVKGATLEQSLSIAYNNLGAIETGRVLRVSDTAQQRVHREAAPSDFRKAVELDPSNAQAEANLQRFGTPQ